MKLEPVFLLAPKPKPRAMPTRRAFLLAGGMFAAGSAIGGACGYSIGVASGGKSAADGANEAEQPLAPTDDAQLDALRKLAVEAPIEELVAKRFTFLMNISRTYPGDTVLWQGVERLGRATLDFTDLADRRITARTILNVFQGCKLSQAGRSRLEPLMTQLGEVR